jgi:hypothetical protein
VAARDLRQGEPHAGERPHMEVWTGPLAEQDCAATQSQGYIASATRFRTGEVHAPNASTWKFWLGRSEARCRSVAVGLARLTCEQPGPT